MGGEFRFVKLTERKLPEPGMFQKFSLSPTLRRLRLEAAGRGAWFSKHVLRGAPALLQGDKLAVTLEAMG